MKKLFTLFAAALVMLAASSCEKNEVLPDNNSEGKIVTLKASINNGETKVSLGEKSGETYPVLWSEGDDIAVAQFVDSDVRVYKFTLKAGEGGTPIGTFTCDDAEGFDPSLEATVALYPYTPQQDFFVVKTNQNYAEKSFDSDAILMMAFMEEGSLKFNNLLGILKLTIKGASDETVSSIELTANKPISGNAKFFDTGEGPFIVTEGPDADYKNNIVLNCPDVAIDTEKEFLITVPAGTYDFAVTINTNKGSYYKSTTNKEILNSVILKMPALDLTDFENSMPYVENGVYLGEGIALPAGEGKTIIWAPVNCGYEPANRSYKGYPYGKLYQWGRKYGQGYKDGNYEDATYPSGDNWLTTGSVEMSAGQSAENKDKFFCKWLETPPANNLWNKGTEEIPAKTEYDPCPEGWRVPTETEFFTLVNTVTYNSILNISPGQVDEVKKGIWFYGKTNETTGSKIFFPFAGLVARPGSLDQDYTMVYRGERGRYWASSDLISTVGIALEMNEIQAVEDQIVVTAYEPCSDGYSVRCIKE